MYIDGDSAISKNMPIPDVGTIDGHHSYVSIVDCVADLMIQKENLLTNMNEWDEIVKNHIDDKEMHIFSCKTTKDMITVQKKDYVMQI